MVRLGFCEVDDWKGNAVDFVRSGLNRFCCKHRIEVVSEVFPESQVLLTDDLSERIGDERGPSSRLFVLVDYQGVAMVQAGRTLELLGCQDANLPRAFFQVLAANLGRWMRTYDYRDAEHYAENQIEWLDEDELKESFYPQVPQARPACLKDLPDYDEAVKFLKKSLVNGGSGEVAELLRLCLRMHAEGCKYDLAYPAKLCQEIPEIEDYIESTDDPLPGALIVAEEGDLTEACFTEEIQYLGQENWISASLMLAINLDQGALEIDRNVMKVFDHLGAMLRSLAVAAKLIQTMRRLYDGSCSPRGPEPGIQAEAGAPAVRGEWL